MHSINDDMGLGGGGESHLPRLANQGTRIKKRGNIVGGILAACPWRLQARVLYLGYMATHGTSDDAGKIYTQSLTNNILTISVANWSALLTLKPYVYEGLRIRSVANCDCSYPRRSTVQALIYDAGE